MSDLLVRTLDGSATTLDAATVNAFADGLRGQVWLPGKPGYETARRVWNAMIDRNPALVVHCAGPGDVMRAVRFAGDHGLLTAVRGGGHNIAGHGVCDGGLLIDLSGMTSVRVDPSAQRAWVEPGARLGDLDRESQVHGLAVPLGINSTTGVAGLTLGGGFGWTSRRFGMTIDNLVSADVVIADGSLRRASATENPDLFWAIRGGGGNFGVVTAFEFQLHAVGPQVMAGLIVHPMEDAAGLLRQYFDLAAAAPDELTCWAVLRKAPPLPFLPEAWHGCEVVIFALCHTGDPAAAEADVAPIRALGTPVADVVGPHDFTAWQGAFDPLLGEGARNYWKSHDFAEMSEGAIATLLKQAGNLPGPECEIFVAHLGGAMGRVAPETTAFPQRGAHFTMNVHTRWQDPGDDDACIAWARQTFEATAPFALGTVYVNFMPQDETDRVAGAYAGNYPRLAAIKAQVDPHNLFRHNQNISAAAPVREMA